MRFALASLVAFVGISSAASGCSQAPAGDTPSGNPIAAPGLGQIVPAGTPFTITWNVSSIPSDVVATMLQCYIYTNPHARSPLPPAASPSSFSAARPPMLSPSAAWPTISPILGSSSGPRHRASRLILPTTVCRSSSAVLDNTNTRPNSASPTPSAQQPRRALPSPRLATARSKPLAAPLLQVQAPQYRNPPP